jgi:hypothetical protein
MLGAMDGLERLARPAGQLDCSTRRPPQRPGMLLKQEGQARRVETGEGGHGGKRVEGRGIEGICNCQGDSDNIRNDGERDGTCRESK